MAERNKQSHSNQEQPWWKTRRGITIVVLFVLTAIVSMGGLFLVLAVGLFLFWRDAKKKGRPWAQELQRFFHRGEFQEVQTTLNHLFTSAKETLKAEKPSSASPVSASRATSSEQLKRLDSLETLRKAGLMEDEEYREWRRKILERR